MKTFNKNNFLIIFFKNNMTKELSFNLDKDISNILLKDFKTNDFNFQKPNNQILILSDEDKKIYLNQEQIRKKDKGILMIKM